MLYANLLLNVLYHIEIEMKIRESCLQTGNFIYKPGISLTKQDFHLQRGILGLQRGFSGYYLPFYIKPYQNMILIHIENNYDGVIKGSIDGDILSVKQGKEHGLGIRRVKELVEKADGVLQITSDNKIFSVHIMIPDKENNKLL